jgi:hypothetical protein
MWNSGLNVLTYDPVAHRSLLFGGRSGRTGNDAFLADTWAWDGRRWIQLAGPIYPTTPASGVRKAPATP